MPPRREKALSPDLGGTATLIGYPRNIIMITGVCVKLQSLQNAYTILMWFLFIFTANLDDSFLCSLLVY